MKSKNVFKRHELKYLITKEQKYKLMNLFEMYMKPDEYGQSSIYNVYFDTTDFLLIRRSLEKPIYKEKLRLRSYGKSSQETNVYLELKKKFDDVVYKRRMDIKESDAEKYFRNEYTLPNSQIGKEIDYVKSFYSEIKPKVFIGYEREAYFGNDDEEFRVTFDENIVYRDEDVGLCSEKYGQALLQFGMVLMEIKVVGSVPLWLTHFLSENKIYKTSYSKYGNAYLDICRKESEKNYVI